MLKKIAMLIMVDGAMVEERYFEFQNSFNEEWNQKDEELTEAQWFFY